VTANPAMKTLPSTCCHSSAVKALLLAIVPFLCCGTHFSGVE
jgi:hypothetical protein